MNSEWYKKIKVVEAITDNMNLYYIVDENYDIVPFIREYIDSIVARAYKAVAPDTIKSYCYLQRHFIIFLKMFNLSIIDLDGKPELLVEFKLWLKNPFRFYENIIPINFDDVKNSISPSTERAIINSVSSLYNYLYATKKIKDNPVIYKNVDISTGGRDKDFLAHTRKTHTTRKNTLQSKTIKKLPKIINQTDFRTFVENIKNLRDKLILLLLKESGIRRGELLGLKLEDIDYGNQGFWVHFRPNNINGARAKAGYGRDRFVYIPVSIMTLIDSYISSDWISANPDNDFLFINIYCNDNDFIGQPMKKSSLNSIFKYYSIKTGIKLHPHMLRHTHVTELARKYIDKGEPINWKLISERLGHSSVATTIDEYSHLEKEDLKKEYFRLMNYEDN